jgi:hypothetical protein
MNRILARLEADDARKAAKQAPANLPGAARIRDIIPILAQVFARLGFRCAGFGHRYAGLKMTQAPERRARLISATRRC